MVDFLGLAIIVTAVTLGVAIAVVVAQMLLGNNRPTCSRCGARLTGPEEACTVCQTPLETPEGRGTEPDPSARRTITVEHGPVEDPEAGMLNPGVTKGMVKAAVAVMFAGIAIRVVGMLDPIGLGIGIPDALMAALTVVGGVAMFLGFVVLDIA